MQSMSFALQQHLAPRVLQCQGYTSRIITVFKSILAGCPFSTSFIKALTQPDLQIIHDEYPKANLGVHVDDTSMQSVAPTFNEILDELVP